ncbi:hypothetical protein [Niveispirillum sp. BGYR6]|uniref:hypothetical protein n=1 Tax=Niveispirillum sp. BGYR6 TaxID=2971249 RepID=UPI0022B9AE91|nr:hypothetical protein [Niveispirillum sp. BGYR6]MDG5496524.1 hypothetical protein [Niveispirillum sp. BGYR6]
MIYTDHAVKFTVRIVDGVWSYEPTQTDGATVTASGGVVVPVGSGSWAISYDMQSAVHELFFLMVNTNTAQVGALTDFDQVIGVETNSGCQNPQKKVENEKEVNVYSSNVTVYFRNTDPEGRPVGISFELWARTVDGLHLLISRDPQVKNEN